MKRRTFDTISVRLLSTVVCLSLSLVSPLVWAHGKGEAYSHHQGLSGQETLSGAHLEFGRFGKEGPHGGHFDYSSPKRGHGHKGYTYGQHLGHHQDADAYIHHLLTFKQAMAFTDEQDAALRHLETSYEKTRVKTKADIALANIDLHELLHNDQALLSNVAAKLHAIFSLKADLYMASIRTRRAAKAVLTDEQRKRMKAVHDRLKAMGTPAISSPYPHHSIEEERKR